MIEVHDLTKRYGERIAVAGVSFSVARGEVLGFLGPNGAGKTTTLKAIAGVLPFTGRIEFDGAPLRPGRAEERPGQGLCLVPEGRGILARMTVHENLLMGGYCRKGGAPEQEINAVYERFPVLQERSAVPAGLLSGGEQQMLAIGRILRTGARLLMLDEPTEGLAPVIIQQIGHTIARLKQQGFTILLVEQNFRFASTVADRFYVMEHGRVIDAFANADLSANMDKLHDYLGV